MFCPFLTNARMLIPSCIQRRTEAVTNTHKLVPGSFLREDRRRFERSELRGWLQPALLVEGATRAPEIAECDEETTRVSRRRQLGIREDLFP